MHYVAQYRLYVFICYNVYMNKDDRDYHARLIHSLYPYIKSALKRRGQWHCADCGAVEGLEIDHKRYSDSLTINDLQALCVDCHDVKTGIANDLRLSGGYCACCQRPY